MLVLDFIIGRLHTVVEKFDRFVIEYYTMYMYVCILMTDAGCSLWIEVQCKPFTAFFSLVLLSHLVTKTAQP